MSVSLDQPQSFLPLALHHHFGGRLLDQDEALLAWATSFLLKAPLSPEALVERFTDSDWVPQPISIELQEAREILQRGFNAGKFVKAGMDEYALDSAEQLRLNLAQEQADRDIKKAEESFRVLVLERFPKVHTRVIEEMWIGLQRFTLAVVLDYVSKTAALDNRFAAQEIIGSVFTKGSAEYDMASAIFPEFIQSSEDGKRLFATALSSAIYALRTTISDSAAEEIRDTLRHRVLYLDTNVIFSVVGLRGEPEYEQSTRRLLELARNQGFSLHYTEATKLEYGGALERTCRRLISADSVDLEPSYMTRRRRGSIDRAYLLQRSDRTPEEFLEYYRDLPAQLKKYGTLSISEAYIPTMRATRLRESELYSEVSNALLTIDYDQKRREHDAYNLAVVLDERDNSEVFSKTPSWLITHHLALARVNRRLDVRLPVVMTLDAWVIHFRRFLSRVEDFDAFLVDMIANNVLSGFRLSDHEIEVASGFLTTGGNREAGEIISAVIQRTPTPTIQKALEAGDDAEAIVQHLIDHDRQLSEGISAKAQKLSEAEISRQATLIAGQQETIKKKEGEVSRLEEERDRRRRALDVYQGYRRTHDAIGSAKQAHESTRDDLLEKLSNLKNRLLICRVISAPITFFVSATAFWALLGSPTAVQDNLARLLLLVGLTPGMITSGLMWVIGACFRSHIGRLEGELANEELEILDLKTELAGLKDPLESAAKQAGLT